MYKFKKKNKTNFYRHFASFYTCDNSLKSIIAKKKKRSFKAINNINSDATDAFLT